MLASPRLSPSLTSRPLPSTAAALGAELGSVLQALGVSAVITDAAGRAVAASADALAAYAGRPVTPADGLDIRICGQRFRVFLAARASRAVLTDLTPRQRRVIELVGQGLRNREIAEQLGISLHTVRRHVEAVLKRLGVSTRAAAAVLLQDAASRSRAARAA